MSTTSVTHLLHGDVAVGAALPALAYPVTATLTLTSDKLLFPNGTTQWTEFSCRAGGDWRER